MIILAKQTGRARFTRLFKDRADNHAPATTRRAGGPGPDMLAAILAETAEQAAIAKLNELLQGGHDVS